MNEPIYIVMDNATRDEDDETKERKEERLYYVDETTEKVTVYQKVETMPAKIVHCNGDPHPRDTAGKKITYYPGMKFIPKEGIEEVFLTNITKFKP